MGIIVLSRSQSRSIIQSDETHTCPSMVTILSGIFRLDGYDKLWIQLDVTYV